MNCYVVKDLLPNYIDELVSDETKEDIQEHLKICPECQLLYEKMSTPIASLSVQNNIKEINFLKKIKTRTMKSIVMAVGGIIVILGILAWIFAIGTPANSKDVAIMKEFQHPGALNNAYLQQVWVIHFELTNNKALNPRTKYVYGTNADGVKVITGCIITLYEVQSSALQECNNYTIGYSYEGTEAPPSDFDYTFTVRYKDKEVVYSMRDEGLFDAP